MAGVAYGRWKFNTLKDAIWPTWSDEVDLRMGLQQLRGLPDHVKTRGIKMEGYRLYITREALDETLGKLTGIATAEKDSIKAKDSQTGREDFPFKLEFEATFPSVTVAIAVLQGIAPEPRADTSFPKKHAKICFVGAGPSSLIMSYFLHEKGYDRMTVLEAGTKFGGRTSLVDSSHLTAEQKAMFKDLAPNYICPLFHNVRDLADRLGVEGLPVNDADGEPDVLLGSSERVSYRKFITMCATDPATGGPPRLVEDLAKFKRLHLELMGPYVAGLSQRPSEEARREIDVDFGTFLQRQELPALAKFLPCFTTTNGLVGIGAWPTYSALECIHPDFIDRLSFLVMRMTQALGLAGMDYPAAFKESAEAGEQIKTMLAKRNLDIYAAINEQLWKDGKHGVDVKYSSSVKRVVRKYGKVKVTWDVVEEGDQISEKTEEFDYLIWSDPLEKARTVIDNLSDVEVDIMSGVTSFGLRSTVLIQDPAPEEPGRFDLSHEGLVGASVGDGKVVGIRYGQRTPEGRRAAMCYQFVAGSKTDTELETLLDDFLKEKDLKNCHKAGAAAMTPCYHHFTQHSLDEGLPWKLRELQGHRETIFIPSELFHTPVHMINYCNMLITELKPLAEED